MANKAGGFLADFGDFIMRGNVVDLAVAVILGGAFGKIVESFVGDIITPALLNPAMQAAGVDNLADLATEGGVAYGLFLSAIINFIVIGLVLFIAISSFESAKRKAQRKQDVEASETPEAPDPVLVSQENLTRAIEQLTGTISHRS